MRSNTQASSSRFSRLEIALGAILALFLLVLAVRGFLDAAGAAQGFGIAIENPADLFYLHVKADRDLASALILGLLLLLGERRAVLAFVAASTVEPVLDLTLSLIDPRGRALYALGVHGSAVLYGVVFCLVLMRRRVGGVENV